MTNERVLFIFDLNSKIFEVIDLLTSKKLYVTTLEKIGLSSFSKDQKLFLIEDRNVLYINEILCEFDPPYTYR